MKIHLINPNTTETMTAKAVTAAETVAAAGTEIIGNQPQDGPVSIEGFYDEVFAIPAMIEQINLNNDCDGHVIACFDDTGVDAARCIANGPVIGICEAGCITASTISNRFSIITTLGRSLPALNHLVQKYGMSHRCASVLASDIPVLELENQESHAIERIETECSTAIERDGAEAILLGCAGMTSLTRHLSDTFHLPVIDGVSAAVKQIEALVSMQLTSSRKNGYQKPVVKDFTGSFKKYAYTA